MGNQPSTAHQRAAHSNPSLLQPDQIAAERLHRRTLSSSSGGRLQRFPLLFSSSSSATSRGAPDRGSLGLSFVGLGRRSSSSGGSRDGRPPSTIATTATSGGARPLFARRILRRQSDGPLSSSLPLAMIEGLGEVAEATDEETSEASRQPAIPTTVTAIRPERSQSEGTGVVTISTRQTTAEREEELAMLGRIRRFTPLIPDQPTSYFNIGNWLPTSGSQQRLQEPDTAIDDQALAGAFLAYQSHQRALCELVCERQRGVVTSIKALDDYASRTEQLTVYQHRSTNDVGSFLAKEVASLESQVLKTRELVYEIVQTLAKLNDMLPRHELALGSKTVESQYPALARTFRRTPTVHNAGVSVEKKRLSIQNRRWDRSSVTLNLSPVLADGRTTAALGHPSPRSLSPLPTTTTTANNIVSATPSSAIGIGPSASTARLRLFVHNDQGNGGGGGGTPPNRSAEPVATSSSSSLPNVLDSSNWTAPLRSPSFWARSITRRPAELDTIDDRSGRSAAVAATDIDNMLSMSRRPTLPDTAEMAARTNGGARVDTTAAVRPIATEMGSLSRNATSQSVTAAATTATARTRDRAMPYTIVSNGRGSLKRQKTRVDVPPAADGTLLEGILRRLNISTAGLTGSLTTAAPTSPTIPPDAASIASGGGSRVMRQRTSTYKMRSGVSRRDSRKKSQRSTTTTTTTTTSSSIVIDSAGVESPDRTPNSSISLEGTADELSQAPRRRTKGKIRHGLFSFAGTG